MSALNNYINYFRDLAIRCAAIGHDPAGETDDGLPGTKRFAILQVEDILNSTSKTSGYPCLLVELYETNSRSLQAYDIRLNTKGAFTILVSASVDDFAKQVIAYDQAESIYLDILKQIFQDHYGPNADMCTRAFASFDFNNLDIIPAVIAEGFGWRVEFGFEHQRTILLHEPPAAGAFN